MFALMETVILIYTLGSLAAALHSLWFIQEELLAVFVGLLSWYYFALWFNTRDIAWGFTLLIVILL